MNDSGVLDRDRMLAALAWWTEAGVDTLVEAEARDWFAAPALSRAASAAETTAETQAAPAAAAAHPAPVTAAPAATSLDELRAEIEAFAGCPLKAAGVNTVFGDGNPAADLMLIGEAPGAEEDRVGRPFVGAAGQLLDRMLVAIGRDRTSAYITNVTYWRPPGNRTPSPEEVQACLPFVFRHISLVAPKVIVAVGAVATRALTGDPTGIMRMRGNWSTVAVEGREFPLLPTLHPAYLLRQPEAKRLAWADLLAVKAKLDAD